MMPLAPRRLWVLGTVLSVLSGCALMEDDTPPDVQWLPNGDQAIAAMMPAQSARSVIARSASPDPTMCDGMFAPPQCDASLSWVQRQRCRIEQNGVILQPFPTAGSTPRLVPFERLRYTALTWWASSGYRVVNVEIHTTDEKGVTYHPCPVYQHFASIAISYSGYDAAVANAARLTTALAALGIASSAPSAP